jgi:hypothetical protein
MLLKGYYFLFPFAGMVQIKLCGYNLSPDCSGHPEEKIFLYGLSPDYLLHISCQRGG